MKNIVEFNGKRAIYSDCFLSHGVAPMTPWEAVAAWLKAPRHFGMANVFSDEWTKVRAGRRVSPYAFGGHPRIIKWDFASTPAGNVGDILVCGRINKDDMVIEGKEFHSALSSDTAATTVSYGTYTIQGGGLEPLAADDVDRFLAATDLDVAGENDLATLQAGVAEGGTQGVGVGPLFVATQDLLLVAVNSVEAIATAARVSGWMLVVRD